MRGSRSLLCWTVSASTTASGSDEIITVENYVRAGPGAILAGSVPPNNHELFSLLAWLTRSMFGRVGDRLRLWSVVPFLAGVAWSRHGCTYASRRLSGVLFLFLATGSPLLLDITPAARGYGLAFLAMVVVVVAALEAARSGPKSCWLSGSSPEESSDVDAPELRHRLLRDVRRAARRSVELRRRVSAAGVLASALAAFGWYAPHWATSRLPRGRRTASRSARSASSRRRSTSTRTGTALADKSRPRRQARLFPSQLLSLVVMARARSSGAVVGGHPPLGAVVTMVVFWYVRLTSSHGSSSYLLVPLFMLAASGAARSSGRTNRPPCLSGRRSSCGHRRSRHSSSRCDSRCLTCFLARPTGRCACSSGRGAGGVPDLPVHAAAREGAGVLPRSKSPERVRPSRATLPPSATARDPFVSSISPFRVRPLRVPCLARRGCGSTASSSTHAAAR